MVLIKKQSCEKHMIFLDQKLFPCKLSAVEELSLIIKFSKVCPRLKISEVVNYAYNSALKTGIAP